LLGYYAAVLICILILVGYVRQYNSVNSQPDVLNSLYSPLQPAALEGLRYHEAGRLSDQQMALLQYQRENLHYLSEEVTIHGIFIMSTSFLNLDACDVSY
jgi:hypothetical protein